VFVGIRNHNHSLVNSQQPEPLFLAAAGNRDNPRGNIPGVTVLPPPNNSFAKKVIVVYKTGYVGIDGIQVAFKWHSSGIQVASKWSSSGIQVASL